MITNYNKVNYHNKDYAVFEIKTKKNTPVVVDWKYFNDIKKLNKNWKNCINDFISCSHSFKDTTREIFLHDIIKALEQNKKGNERGLYPIVHINRIGLDNRIENLLYDTIDKKHNKNIKKKKRTITLPKNSGININELPTYVWYLKPNGSHGDRFSIEIGDVKWKTTSSKKVSLRYKLEEAKKYLRELKESRLDLFNNYCMNGEYTRKGKKLTHSFNEIIKKAGYTIKNNLNNELTDIYLQEREVKTDIEKKLLKRELSKKKNKKRRLISNLPKDSGINIEDLPTYSYYRPLYKDRGDYFVVENHPNQTGKIWQTTSSKKISIQEKFKDLMRYIKGLE